MANKTNGTVALMTSYISIDLNRWLEFTFRSYSISYVVRES